MKRNGWKVSIAHLTIRPASSRTPLNTLFPKQSSVADHYRNILCVRADNMGDVIMSSPAFRALKETYRCRITLLTSGAGSVIAPYLECIDDVIVADLPWVKTNGGNAAALLSLAEEIRKRNFDAGIVFTVYSQSSLPAAMLLFMAGVPVRAAYARENPYDLINRWAPDHEPYDTIRHQVRRDLDLVASLGAHADNERLELKMKEQDEESLLKKLNQRDIDLHSPYIILHPGVSEVKREYPAERWIAAGKLLAQEYKLPLLVTGSATESELAGRIAEGIGMNALSIAGMLTIGEFIWLVNGARCVVSVNTGTIHIAAAIQTPTVVLYAQTNPQHTPWQSPHEILSFSIPEKLKSRNTIIGYVNQKLYTTDIPFPQPQQILSAVAKLIEK
ncbi:glycosyltransferase family 9 protein [Dyadobacter sp. CY323]|uniref:glycosyltransferase family 9 protein n=1 Tax=Dyadobacter sp. CY323 TaxID=2907302 RepID=UPI001F4027C5|nr:glycosyltransferase family 9 protein [Dyadobacter sp. CY323]MCE6989721.1 glycosyltransferase family 9 protein [Dyadobacter sp. CY323]